MKTIFLNEITAEELKGMINKSVLAALQMQKNNEPDKEDILLSRKEAAKLLDVSLPALTKYTQSGEVKGYTLGGKIKYKKSELIAAMDAIEPLKYRRG